MVRTNQGGSILGFVIVGVIMALLLVGGAYFVQHNLSSMVDEEPVASDDGSTPNPGTEEQGADDNKSENSQTNESGNTGQESSVPAPTTPAEPTPSATNNHTDGHQTQPESSSTNNLPETGPGDMLAVGLLLSGIIGVLAAYFRSRTLPASL